MTKAYENRMLLQALVLAAVLCTTQAEGTAKAPLKHSVATGFCSFSKAAKQAANKLAQTLDAVKATLNQNRKAHLQNLLVAVKRPTEQIAALILGQYANTQAASGLSDLGKWAPDETKTIGQALYTSGRLDGFIDVLVGHRSENSGQNKNCIANDGDGTTKAFDFDALCGPTEVAKAGNEPGDLKALIETAFGGIGSAAASGGNNHCVIFDDLNTAYSTKTAATDFLAGLIKVHQTTGLTAATAIAAQKSTNKILKDIDANWPKVQQAYTTAAGRSPTTDQEYKDLLKDESSRQKLRAAAQTVNNWKPADKPANMDDYLKQVFKIDANGNSAYVTAMKEISMDVPTKDGETQKKELFEMSEEDLEAALAVEIRRLSSENAKLTTEVKQLRQNQGKQATEDTCNKMKGETACNNKPFCTYNATETDENKKCKFNETKASKSGVSVAQAQTGGTQTTTDKCKDKKKDDCKSPDCKWEGETCKDSSFILNKQFALSVVSAAFAALLF
uniref:Variable surface glycoprotein n=1 Tax=Trypanosoma brucei TaxID=5691 RepID=Q968K6_9TRYP|nr:variable surface glycoprotein [Trypanosoma brucei]